MNKFDNKRYNSLNYFFRNKFGEKIVKVALDGGFSCPNRDGTISTLGCTFCSERGSGDFSSDANLTISDQFNESKLRTKSKWKNSKYIAYFQAYTNTYDHPEKLREKYSEALKQKDVVGISIATRPDCLDNEILEVIKELNEKTYVIIELGLQTINERISKEINRGYKLRVFEESLKKLRNIGVDVVVHVIFGLPGETKEEMFETIKYLSNKDIQGIKFHLLHVMKNTPLENQYKKEGIDFLTEKEYIYLVSESIAMLPKNIVIHRLTGDSPRKLLIGPMWSLNKWSVLNGIDSYLKSKDLYQGKNFNIGSNN